MDNSQPARRPSLTRDLHEQAHERYKDWIQRGVENHPFLVCALCESGGVVTIMAGYALCWLCADAIRNTYPVQGMVEIARRRAGDLRLPFGPLEWMESFKGEVRRERNREKRQKKTDAGDALLQRERLATEAVGESDATV